MLVYNIPESSADATGFGRISGRRSLQLAFADPGTLLQRSTHFTVTRAGKTTTGPRAVGRRGGGIVPPPRKRNGRPRRSIPRAAVSGRDETISLWPWS